MNLEDVIDPEYGLQQDDWSESRPRFGDEQQLEVVGWSGKRKDRSDKLYILKCSKCSQDNDLFGEGYFKVLKCSLVRGTVPCGCSKSPKWSQEQFHTLCTRKSLEVGHKFLGFIGGWEGQTTKIKMSCEKHGEWSSGTVANFISKGHGCPTCRNIATGVGNRKPDHLMVKLFFESGAFHTDTDFWRSGRLTKQGRAIYWYMYCPRCDEVGESTGGSLQRGMLSCACNNHRQQECYINWIVDEQGSAVAIKFGMARDSKQRIKRQDRMSGYILKQHSIYTFPDVSSCKAAERECKQTLECGVLSKEEMPDGYTETTSVLNLGRIKRIYEKHGGVLND